MNMKYHGCDEDDEEEAWLHEEKNLGDAVVMEFHLLHTALARKMKEMGRRARIFSRISSGRASDRSWTPLFTPSDPIESIPIYKQFLTRD